MEYLEIKKGGIKPPKVKSKNRSPDESIQHESAKFAHALHPFGASSISTSSISSASIKPVNQTDLHS